MLSLDMKLNKKFKIFTYINLFHLTLLFYSFKQGNILFAEVNITGLIDHKKF